MQYDDGKLKKITVHVQKKRRQGDSPADMNLISKIGQQKFDLLKVKAASNTKMSDFEYEQLIKYYKALNKKLRKEKGI